jgi:hypothetical protein
MGRSGGFSERWRNPSEQTTAGGRQGRDHANRATDKMAGK